MGLGIDRFSAYVSGEYTKRWVSAKRVKRTKHIIIPLGGALGLPETHGASRAGAEASNNTGGIGSATNRGMIILQEGEPGTQSDTGEREAIQEPRVLKQQEERTFIRQGLFEVFKRGDPNLDQARRLPQLPWSDTQVKKGYLNIHGLRMDLPDDLTVEQIEAYQSRHGEQKETGNRILNALRNGTINIVGADVSNE
jgi:hypothetical protein